MAKDLDKYYEPLKLMIPIRFKYIKKVLLKYKNKGLDESFLNSKALDLGCGKGEFLKIVSELGANCLGIDEYKNFEFKKTKKLKFIQSDIFKYLENKSTEKFDYVFCFEVLEHLEKKEKFFKLAKKKLKKNGLFFISTINKNWLSKKLIVDFAENYLKIIPKNTHDHNLFLEPMALKKLCKDNNLKMINLIGLTYNPILKNFSFSKSNLVNYICVIKN